MAKATLNDALAALSARDFDTTRALVIDSDIDICAGTAIEAVVPFANAVDFPELVGVNTASRHLFAVAVKMGHDCNWNDPSLVSLVVAMIESDKVKVLMNRLRFKTHRFRMSISLQSTQRHNTTLRGIACRWCASQFFAP